VKKEPDSFTRVKKEHNAHAPPSSKKARRLADEAARQLDYQVPDNPVEFPGPRAVERESFNEVQPGTLEFALPGPGKTQRGPRQSAHAASVSVLIWMTTRRRTTPVRAGATAAAMVARTAAPGRPRMSRQTTTTAVGTKTTTSSTAASG
jgi:hypothetical protein